MHNLTHITKQKLVIMNVYLPTMSSPPQYILRGRGHRHVMKSYNILK